MFKMNWTLIKNIFSRFCISVFSKNSPWFCESIRKTIPKNSYYYVSTVNNLAVQTADWVWILAHFNFFMWRFRTLQKKLFPKNVVKFSNAICNLKSQIYWQCGNKYYFLRDLRTVTNFKIPAKINQKHGKFKRHCGWLKYLVKNW